MDERILITQAQEGNKTAMELLYRSTIDYIYRYVMSSLNDKDIADDVVSVIYLNAFTNINKFRSDSSFKTWLHIIARNEIYHQYKSNGLARRNIQIDENFLKSEEYVINEFDDQGSDDNYEMKREQKELVLEMKVAEALSKIKSRYAEILKLRFISGLTIKECAEVLGITENNVKVLQNRALKSASKLLKNNETNG